MRIFFLSTILLAVFSVMTAALFFGFRRDRPSEPAGALSEEFLVLEPTSVTSIRGWLRDDPSDAFAAYLRSCERLRDRAPDAPASAAANASNRDIDFGTVAEWREACRAGAEILRIKLADEGARRAAIRSFFEGYFRPFRVLAARRAVGGETVNAGYASLQSTGKFTGYFEPEYNGSGIRDGHFSTPVLARPGDLIEVDLGLFRDELAGQRIAGRVESGKLEPYPDRRSIEDAPETISQPLAWISPVDLFFMQIQGSGRVRFEDGQVRRFGYDGQNGHVYTAIGRVLVEEGVMPLEAVSMQSIRAWLETAPADDAEALLHKNASYVFFRDLGAPDDLLGPPGAQDVALTPQRSLAVDRRFHVLGAPIWLSFDADADGSYEFEKLMVAQDVGGAIKGPVRGDVFWGSGPQAAAAAGEMNAAGEMIVFLPLSVAARIAAAKS